jgi:D-alanyl-D-alanine carboxypeptidase/D-alanyl-D-alanine-endopeptidase (penicillin-binding protein 4)
MKQTATFLTIIMCFLFESSLSAQNNNIQKYIESLKQDTLFTDAVVGIMVTDSKGKTIASWNPDMPLLTASTMKTISTGMALTVLGKDYRFSTKLAHDGYIKDGVLYGNLYIIGGADPTLGSKDTLATPVETLFAKWKEAVIANGIKRINGNLVADDRFFEPEIVPESWAWNNIGPSYGGGTSGLSFNENLQYFNFRPGLNKGDKVFFNKVYPEIPEMKYIINLTTAERERGRSSYHVSDLARVGRFSGSAALGADSVIITVANKYPHLSCALEFRKYLESWGIHSNSEILDARERDLPAEENLIVIDVTYSPSLTSIINVTNRISNNFYAETLLKMVGKQVTGTGSYDSSRVAVQRLLKEMGLKTKGYTQADGSGLSRQNYVSARFFCNYFAKMKENPNFDLFFNSLPQPGQPGTLRSVLSNEKPSDKERIHAKSGSLANVRCYAGYTVRKNGEIIHFAILTNNFSARTAQMQIGIEGFMRELTKY